MKIPVNPGKMKTALLAVLAFALLVVSFKMSLELVPPVYITPRLVFLAAVVVRVLGREAPEFNLKESSAFLALLEVIKFVILIEIVEIVMGQIVLQIHIHKTVFRNDNPYCHSCSNIYFNYSNIEI